MSLPSRHRARWTGPLALGATAVLAACGAAGTAVDTGAGSAASSAPTSSTTSPAPTAPTSSTAPTGPTSSTSTSIEVADGPTGTTCPSAGYLTELDGLSPIVGPDETAATEALVARGATPPPGGWRLPADPPAVDWDLDGATDPLTFDPTTSRVTITWSAGSFTVTGVPNGNIDGRIDYPVVEPAVAGDVTGDGAPDLIVVVAGETRVVVGPGRSAASATVPFAELGTAVAGWVVPLHRRTTPSAAGPVQGDLLPTEHAEPALIWDADADGITDFVVHDIYVRGAGGFSWYRGQPCPIVP